MLFGGISELSNAVANANRSANTCEPCGFSHIACIFSDTVLRSLTNIALISETHEISGRKRSANNTHFDTILFYGFFLLIIHNSFLRTNDIGRRVSVRTSN